MSNRQLRYNELKTTLVHWCKVRERYALDCDLIELGITAELSTLFAFLSSGVNLFFVAARLQAFRGQ
jgi:hypothetical protein